MHSSAHLCEGGGRHGARGRLHRQRAAAGARAVEDARIHVLRRDVWCVVRCVAVDDAWLLTSVVVCSGVCGSRRGSPGPQQCWWRSTSHTHARDVQRSLQRTSPRCTHTTCAVMTPPAAPGRGAGGRRCWVALVLLALVALCCCCCCWCCGAGTPAHSPLTPGAGGLFLGGRPRPRLTTAGAGAAPAAASAAASAAAPSVSPT
jgi:hypothetical protein